MAGTGGNSNPLPDGNNRMLVEAITAQMQRMMREYREEHYKSKVGFHSSKVKSPPKERKAKSPPKDRRIKCFNCLEYGDHIAKGCPTKSLMVTKEYGMDKLKVEKVGEGVENKQKVLDVPSKKNEEIQKIDGSFVEDKTSSVQSNGEIVKLKDNIFHTKCHVQGKVCLLVINSDVCANLASTYMVEKLKLPTLTHPNPYNLSFEKAIEGVRVTKQVVVAFSIGNYQDEILCDVIPMHYSHLMLGKQWHYNRMATYDTLMDRYRFRMNGKKIALVPLTFLQVWEEQEKMQKKIKEFKESQEKKREGENREKKGEEEDIERKLVCEDELSVSKRENTCEKKNVCKNRRSICEEESENKNQEGEREKDLKKENQKREELRKERKYEFGEKPSEEKERESVFTKEIDIESFVNTNNVEFVLPSAFGNNVQHFEGACQKESSNELQFLRGKEDMVVEVWSQRYIPNSTINAHLLRHENIKDLHDNNHNLGAVCGTFDDMVVGELFLHDEFVLKKNKSFVFGNVSRNMFAELYPFYFPHVDDLIVDIVKIKHGLYEWLILLLGLTNASCSIMELKDHILCACIDGCVMILPSLASLDNSFVVMKVASFGLASFYSHLVARLNVISSDGHLILVLILASFDDHFMIVLVLTSFGDLFTLVHFVDNKSLGCMTICFTLPLHCINDRNMICFGEICHDVHIERHEIFDEFLLPVINHETLITNFESFSSFMVAGQFYLESSKFVNYVDWKIDIDVLPNLVSELMNPWKCLLVVICSFCIKLIMGIKHFVLKFYMKHIELHGLPSSYVFEPGGWIWLYVKDEGKMSRRHVTWLKMLARINDHKLDLLGNIVNYPLDGFNLFPLVDVGLTRFGTNLFEERGNDVSLRRKRLKESLAMH